MRPRDDARPWHAPWRALARVVCYANGKQIVVRSLSDDSQTVFYDGHQYPPTVARVSPNGEWVASGDASGVVRVWGLNEHQTLKAEHRVLSGAVDDIQWSPGARLVACGDGRGGAFARVFLWDSGSSVGDISGATKRVVSVAFRPKRPFKIAAASEDFTVSFFEGPPCAFAGAKHKHGNYANCVRFPRTALFASVGSDGFGVVYDGGTGVPLALCPPRSARSGKKNEDTNDGHAGSVYTRARGRRADAFCSRVGADKTAVAWDASGVLQQAADGSGARAIPGGSLDALPRLAVTRTFRFAKEPGVGDMQVGPRLSEKNVRRALARRDAHRFRTFSTPTRRSRESRARLSRAVRVRRRHGRSWATPNPCSRWEGSGQTAASSPCPSPRFKRRTRQPARRYGGARRREI